MRTWTTEDGLPHNSLTTIVQDTRGFLWMASLGGLVRFDGVTFKSLQLSAQERPRGYNIRALAADPEAGLLFEPTSGRILSFRDGKVGRHPLADVLGSRQVKELYHAPDGAWWASFPDGRLLRWTPETTQWFGPDEGLHARNNQRATFAVDAAGTLWVCASGFFGTYHDGALHPSSLGLAEPQSITNDPGGGIWICTQEALLRLREGEISTLARDVPWRQASAELRRIDVNARGEAWIAAGRLGLFRWSEQTGLQQMRIPFPVINYVMEDREGSIWIASDGNGLGQLREKTFQRFDTSSGLQEDVCNAVFCASDGALWLANQGGGIARIQGDAAVPLDLKVAGKTPALSTLCLDHQGNLWAGGRSGLYRFAPPYEQGERLPRPAQDVNLLYTARNGDVWFASFAGAFGYFRRGEMHVLPSGDRDTSQSIRSIAEGAEGEIWLGTYHGDLFRYRDGQLKAQNVGFPIHSLHTDAEGRLWIATVDGLLVRQGEQFVRLTETQGLADNLISQLSEDPHGNLWFASRSGLYYARKAALLDVAEGRQETFVSHRYGKDQGLTGLSFLNNYFPATQTGADSRLWFVSSDGVIAIDTNAVPAEQAPPHVYFDAVRIDGEPKTVGGPELRLPPGPHRIEIDFAVPCFTDPRNLLIRHRLEGADPDWNDTDNARTISYSGLAPGTYRLLITAANGPNSWTPTPATLVFRVPPAWWQTAWFRIGAALLAGLLLVLIVRKWSQHHLRQRLQRLERDQALEQERARIARDLHDDLGGRLTALQLLAARLPRAAPKDLPEGLQLLAERAHRLNSDVHGIVWLMTPRESSLQNLAEFLRRYASELFKNTQIHCETDDPEGVPAHPISPDAQHHVFFVAKEALTNVLKHAEASQVQVDFACDQRCFRCTIRDNGHGFDPARTALDGNGLRNMQTRLREIKGELHVASTPGEGTTVTISLPIP